MSFNRLMCANFKALSDIHRDKLGSGGEELGNRTQYKVREKPVKNKKQGKKRDIPRYEFEKIF